MATPSSVDEFDVLRVRDAFTAALRDKANGRSNIGTQNYLNGYRHLLKFVDQLGWIFGFVKDDVVDKVAILQSYLDGADAEHFVSIQQGIAYEKRKKLIETNPLNFSRTVLRLHRALLFILEFLRALNERAEAESTHALALHAYEQTLAQHHGFLIRQSVKIGFRMLPTRRQLDEIIYQRKKSTELVAEYETFLLTLDQIYQIIQRFYQEENLLQLP